MSNQKTLTSYVYKIIEALKQNGVEDVVISPGSRSTPLAYGFASTKDITVSRQVDERSAGFMALGVAKAKSKPVVLLCTSGTAAANYYPAIVEAKYARVPLIVITADRPHELREVGAPQAINQVGLYGDMVKWSVDFPIPDEHQQTLPFIERHVIRGINLSMTAPFGPIHFNVPFREPLLIDFQQLPSNSTFKGSYVGEIAPSSIAKERLSCLLNTSKKGLLIIGELPLGRNLQHFWTLIRKVKWPVLVETLSNLRTNIPEDCKPYIITTYDALLKSKIFKETIKADTVIRFGAQPVSKFLNIYLTEMTPTHYVVIDEDPAFRDSTALTTEFVHASIGEWLEELSIQGVSDSEYLHQWQIGDEIVKKQIAAYQLRESDEGAIVKSILDYLPNKSDLFVSSSMPIRDLDTFLLPTSKDVQVFANRGANGIDGVMSTAIGFSMGRPDRESYLLIGDLAFLHDVNGLIATRYQNCKLNVIVLNNDGGGIFSYLPQSSIDHYYEDLFGTPTALQFDHIAKMFNMDYVQIKNIHELSEDLFQKESQNSLRLIEIFTNRQENVKAHRGLWQRIQEELEQ